MALVACYECESQVSTKALACPHCGAPSETVLAGETVPALAANGLGAIPVARQKVHPATFTARAYFTIGGLIAAPIGPFHGVDTLMIYLAQFLLLGLGVALIAHGHSQQPRDKPAQTTMAVGWVYFLVVASAICTANIVRFI